MTSRKAYLPGIGVKPAAKTRTRGATSPGRFTSAFTDSGNTVAVPDILAQVERKAKPPTGR